MPLVRIDVAESMPAETINAISEAIYSAMVKVAKVPANDKFQIVTRHSVSDLIYPENGYLGVTCTKGIVFLQITWLSGRTVEVKEAFLRSHRQSHSRAYGSAPGRYLHQPHRCRAGELVFRKQ